MGFQKAKVQALPPSNRCLAAASKPLSSVGTLTAPSLTGQGHIANAEGRIQPVNVKVEGVIMLLVLTTWHHVLRIWPVADSAAAAEKLSAITELPMGATTCADYSRRIPFPYTL